MFLIIRNLLVYFFFPAGSTVKSPRHNFVDDLRLNLSPSIKRSLHIFRRQRTPNEQGKGVAYEQKKSFKKRLKIFVEKKIFQQNISLAGRAQKIQTPNVG